MHHCQERQRDASDSAGNQTDDATGNRWFDGENRKNKATQGGTTSHDVYDDDGKRVGRIIGSIETWMIYGIPGYQFAVYAVAASAASLHFFTAKASID